MPRILLPTTEDALIKQVEILRRLGPERRSMMALELSEEVLNLARQGIRRRNPEYNNRQVQLACAKLLLGETLFAKAFSHVNREIG